MHRVYSSMLAQRYRRPRPNIVYQHINWLRSWWKSNWCFEVPGSLEIPLQAKLLAQNSDYSIIVAAGLITNGGIYRHEYVAQTVISALLQVQLEAHVPILSMVLTPLHFHDNEEHSDFFYKHMKVKGVEAAMACIKTLENLNIVNRRIKRRHEC